MRKQTILILNSDPEKLIILSRSIKNENMDIKSFELSLKALDFIKETPVPPDLIITDLHLAKVDGWRFCRLLRSPEFQETNSVPILITSSIFPSPDLSYITSEIGANNHLAFPDTDEKIHDVIISTLKEETNIKPPVVLVVEDDGNILKLTERGLSAYGYSVLKAENGSEAIRVFRKEKPDVVILDHGLPDIKSYNLLPKLKKETDNDNIVFIITTGAPDPDLAIRYIAEGTDAYIRKPFDIKYLVNLINKAQREKALQRVEDLTELRTKSLQEIGKRFHDLYENAPVGYHTLSPDGTILSMNSTELNWLGYKSSEIIGKKKIFDMETPKSIIKGKEIFKTLKKSGELGETELEFICKDGTIMPVRIQSSAITNEEGKFVASRTVVRDMRENKILEEQLRHAQKMESLGEMSVGIAHNFNNLLTPILINASDFIHEFPEDSEEHEMLQDIIDASKRGSDLVKQLVALGQPSTTQHEPIDLQKLITSTARLMRNAIDQSIQIEIDVPEEMISITGNASQIQQLLLNLCFNARDAMPNGGIMIIKLQQQEVSEETLYISAMASQGYYTVLSVSDTGSGMTRDIQDKIFDPFFTTKGLAKNTGLGLSTAYSIAKDHGGFFHVYSEPQEGSKFRFYIPVPEDEAKEIGKRSMLTLHKKKMSRKTSPIKTKEKETPSSFEETKCILIIDDQPEILRSATRILKKAGYSTISAQDGITGLDILRRSLSPSTTKDPVPEISMVLLDVVLPNMSGEKIFEHIKEISKDMPVVISSGYDCNERIQKFLSKGAQATISKPFERNVLLRTIKETLDPTARK